MGECALASRTGVGAICRPLTNELGRGCRRNLGSSLQPLLYPTNRFTHPAYEHAAAEEDPFRSEPQPWCERRCRSRKCCGAVRFDDCCAFRTFGESPEALKNRSPLAASMVRSRSPRRITQRLPPRFGSAQRWMN